MTTCGGLTEAKRIVELARARGALVCPGNWSTQILGAATVHLAAYSPITPFIEFAPAEVYDSPLRRELQAAGFPVRNGAISFPDRARHRLRSARRDPPPVPRKVKSRAKSQKRCDLPDDGTSTDPGQNRRLPKEIPCLRS